MLLLVTGASGVGKTTVRRLIESQLGPEVECAELREISADPPIVNLAWRHRTAEIAVRRAAQLQREGRHFLLCGAPVAAVELAAAPSAAKLDGIAVCLLDASADVQAARLRARGDPVDMLVHHQAFADWMRRQATDPLHMLEVVSTNGWDEMRWDRLPFLAPHWHVHTIDTTDHDPPAVAAAVLSWCRSARSGAQPLVRPALTHE